ncbi:MULTISPECIES: hypothetical protein [unclassified Luteimonas]
MRTHLRMVLMAMAAVMLAACATDGSQLSKATPQHQGRLVTDTEYVAYVERKALSRGVEVYWVQPPTRAVASTDTDE